MMGLLAIGFIANLLIKPVASRFHEPSDEELPTGPAPTEREKV
jgi:hypothetical protein